ncbi:MAG: 30S ribosomal protein S12 methylthiotransferase RimO [Lachnospiraceae bacterium]|nr:30S ribosomal protein S12 methylthiotransferase RimO [Ruminococcus sp.]MCM1275723.1 30S ribosomal protein S12 methylthiotransferase RimO [Lachnospiraceae bacterium]
MSKDNMRRVRVAVVSLGCAKNQVDAEQMMARLAAEGYAFVEEPGLSDIVLLNTCGFITAAKEEAIEWLNELIALKNEGTIKYIVVTGCLSERYRDEFVREYPEVDAVVGIAEYENIADIFAEMTRGHVCRFGAKESHTMEGRRILSTLPHYAYLRIADGCDNCCSYCAIPQIRGRFRSRPMENIVNEARKLAADGVKELVIIAQDVTRYGLDLYGRLALPELLNGLCEIDGLKWIRLLYCYPERITDELIECIKRQEKIVKYLDIPLQHCDGELLKKMNRRGDENSLRELIAKLRREIPDITLRTTFITGFPGETEEQFNRLGEFAQDMKFERMGCFAYSEEENTPAAAMPNQIDEEVREHRKEILEEQQDTRVAELYESMVGSELEVVVEGYDRWLEHFFGRSAAFAPEIDGMIYFSAPEGTVPRVGEFVNIRITDVLDNNLIGELIRG